MLNSRIQDAFNEQLNAELFSAYLYLSMSAYFESENLAGMATWMRIQAQEELLHADRFFNFINDRDGRVVLKLIDAPKVEWSSPLEAFQDALEHERKITGLISELVDLSLSEKDHAGNTFLQWFVTEQVEEEASVKTIADKLELVGDNPVALYMLDGELGQRTLPAPAETTA
jgi:ferritin